VEQPNQLNLKSVMSCQQKSGVFLNILCSNTEESICSNCNKAVCETHAHLLETKHYCEDCFWERFILSKEERAYRDTDTFITDTSRTSYNSNTPANDSDAGFGGGFGGGDFGGGGANGAWTEGDMQSLSETDSAGGLLSSNDDTFFYS